MAGIYPMKPPHAAANHPPSNGERRRSGRSEAVSPHLIAILRNAATETPSQDGAPVDAGDKALTDPRLDDLKPARGLMIGLAIVVPFWIALALAIWWAT